MMNFFLPMEEIEQGALQQFFNAMKHEFTVHGALMPDAHTGYSLPIGAVIATKNVIVPEWVGNDIGCGVLALELENVDIQYLKQNGHEIYQQLKNIIAIHNKANIDTNFECDTYDFIDVNKQLGTLGGGNHFLEIAYSSQSDRTFVVVHTGSRGFGAMVADKYIKLARKYGLQSREINYFEANSHIGEMYLDDMNKCINFAYQNRKYLANQVKDLLGANKSKMNLIIDSCHNYAEYDRLNQLYIHRKGASGAKLGEFVIIPANMRDGSYIVEGKGNAQSMNSCSHGAGRTMSRSQAKKFIDTETFNTQMKNAQVEFGNAFDLLDEAPDAYKDINIVMENQKELVKIVDCLKPIINIKG